MKKVLGFFLFFIFLGYFSSITFFPHTHIVDGITVVHSHPYKSQPGSNPANHNHPKSGYQLIQFISVVVFLLSILYTGVYIARVIPVHKFNVKDIFIIKDYFLAGNNRPRAPAF